MISSSIFTYSALINNLKEGGLSCSKLRGRVTLVWIWPDEVASEKASESFVFGSALVANLSKV